MQAIRTSFLCPTNFRGSRIKAVAGAGSVTLGWDHALNPEDNHASACLAFSKKLGWGRDYVGGTLADGSMVWVSTHSMSPRVLDQPA